MKLIENFLVPVMDYGSHMAPLLPSTAASMALLEQKYLLWILETHSTNMKRAGALNRLADSHSRRKIAALVRTMRTVRKHRNAQTEYLAKEHGRLLDLLKQNTEMNLLIRDMSAQDDFSEKRIQYLKKEILAKQWKEANKNNRRRIPEHTARPPAYALQKHHGASELADKWYLNNLPPNPIINNRLKQIMHKASWTKEDTTKYTAPLMEYHSQHISHRTGTNHI